MKFWDPLHQILSNYVTSLNLEVEYQEGNNFNNHVDLNEESSEVRLVLKELNHVLTTANHNERYYRHQESNFFVRDKAEKEDVEYSVVSNVRGLIESPLLSNVSKCGQYCDRHKQHENGRRSCH